MFSIFVDSQYQYTGYEHTRLVDLLTLLAVISVVMWIVVMLCIAARHIAILWFRHARQHNRNETRRDTDHEH